MIFEIFVVPMCEKECGCRLEEIYSEDKLEINPEINPCAAGTCDCMGKEENYFKPVNKRTDAETLREFDTLFNKYTEANKLIISLNKQNELIIARNEDLKKTNDYLVEQNSSIKKKYMEIFEALKTFEKRVSSLPV